MRNTCVLMYHGVSHLGGHGTLNADAFEHQIKLLKRLFDFVSLDNLLSGRQFAKKKILLTFDDGFHNNYEYAMPVLKRLGVPALFFVNNRHGYKGKYLWFSYLRALEGYFKGTEIKMHGCNYYLSPEKHAESLRVLRTNLLDLSPHPSELYKVIEQELPPLESFVPGKDISEYFSGMSPEEIKQTANDPLFDIGIHTADHAFLTKCNPDEIRNQITQNIEFIQNITQSHPLAIAYPGGDYNSDVVRICSALSIRFGFSLQPVSKCFNNLEIPRLGIYSASPLKLLIKVLFFKQIHNLRIPIG